MSSVSPFRLTPDDMTDLDRKTAQGLEPLLDALNVVLQQLVSAVNSQPTSKTYSTTFVSELTGSAYVSFAPPIAKPSSVVLNQLTLNDGSDISSLYSWTWAMNGASVRLLFIGLDMAAKYSCRVTIT